MKAYTMALPTMVVLHQVLSKERLFSIALMVKTGMLMYQASRMRVK